MKRCTIGALALLLTTAAQSMATPTYTFLGYDQLDGWAEDDHSEALAAFVETCGDIARDEWARLCDFAKDAPAARDFFELFFQPVLIEDGSEMLFTGYYEPELQGALQPDDVYRYPLYGVPNDLRPGTRYLTRREIEESAVLDGQGLEIAWLRDPVEKFFLQIQGSGRISLPDGGFIRVGYAGKNGHDYTSVGGVLVARGTFEPHEVSAQVIKNWVRNNPEEGQALLWENDSYVFFREVNEVPADRGPLGAMNRSITPMRSIAVDPDVTLLGAPVWIEKDGANPLRRLMIAQDTGSAIRGAQRADIFFGTGDAAGRAAGRVRDGGRMVVLMPVAYALSKLPETVE